MKILVTGASGFIGSSFLRRFAGHADLEIYGVGRRLMNDFPASICYQTLPLDQLTQLNFTPDVIIHAAGRTSPWASTQQYQQDNVETTQQVIDFCNQCGLPRLIFLSSAAVYYRFEHQLNLQESQELGTTFTNEYGRSKYQAEQLIRAYQGEKTIFRPCAVFGTGDQLLLPPLFAAAQKNQLVRLKNKVMAAQADIMPIEMLCDYLLRAAYHPHLKSCYNISAGQPVATEQFLDQVLSQLGLPLPVRTIKLSTAMRFAELLEWLWRWLPLSGEPPITRFGIGVFGYTCTLDVAAMYEDFGKPKEDLHQCLQAFLQHYRMMNKCC